MDAARRLRDQSLSSEAITRSLLDRIERVNTHLGCFLTVLGEQALQAARTADREIAAGHWRGHLHGIPIAVKDILHMEGLPTSAGMELLAELPANEDATVISRLKQAGAVILGKLHMTEGAGISYHPNLPPAPRNPWGANYWSGVSSSGSGVAVAAGLCFAAIGTDTGGSIRMPSFVNGITGIKPTWGRVSRHGLVPLIEYLDHVGPMARSVEDSAVVLYSIAGGDPGDATSLLDPVPDYMAELRKDARGLRIGVDRDLNSKTTPEVAKIIDATIEIFHERGFLIQEITLPPFDDVMINISLPLMTGMAVAHVKHYPEHAKRYGPQLRQGLEAAYKIDGPTVARGWIEREKFCGLFARVFQSVDLLLVPSLTEITPTCGSFMERAEDMLAMQRGFMQCMSPFNITGLPTLSLPAGFSSNGLPLGIQLAGPRLSEGVLCAAGHAFQQHTDFHVRRPPQWP
jgi:amidase